MSILRHLYLSTACRAPDEPAIPEPEVIAPVAEVIAPEPEPQPEPEPAPEPVVAEVKPEPKPESATIPRSIFQKVVAEVRGEKRQVQTELEAANQRTADLQAIIERMQAGEKPETRPAPAPAAPQDFNAAVKAEAAKQKLYDDTMAVRTAGESEFTDFGDSLQVLNAIGATNDDFVADLLAVDKAGAHKLLDKLAKDPEKAASLVGMDSRRRIAELTRMADAPKTEVKPIAEAPKPAISKAPAPKPAISPLAAAADVDPTTPEGNEKLSDVQWEKWYKAKYQKTA